MLLNILAQLALSAFLWPSASAQKEYDATTTLAGSGTTNPSKLIWNQQQILMDRSLQNLKLSYRATGSSTGKAEFIAYNNDFACSEIPLSTAEMEQVNASVLTLPFTIGGVSVFHSVPLGNDPLVMNADTLAKIFQRNITTWGAAEILALNPTIPEAMQAQPITVVHRTTGSSSTLLLSQFLDSAADVWVLGQGSTLQWSEDTVSIFGSSEMASTIAATPYAIGYLDAGFGYSTGLSEITLQNAAGNFIRSKDSPFDAIADFAVSTGLIPCASCNWENVSLVNLPGENTWPMVAFSYFLVRSNLSDRPNGALTQAQLRFSLSDQGQAMNEVYGFASVGASLLSQSREALNTLALDPLSTSYSFEYGTEANVGSGLYYFSDRRESYLTSNVDGLLEDVEELQESTDYLLSFDPDLELHGSGTTNPSKYFWKVMAKLEASLQSPTKLTYRAVGSSTGIAEFIANANQFGSGDIPFSPAQYADAEREGQFLQIPISIGAVSVFHNAVAGLIFTPDVLAKIFNRDIIAWDDFEILALNPSFQPPAGQEIYVVHRTKGSSSTSVFTCYLADAAPSIWTRGCGSTVDWPEDTINEYGSSGVASFLQANKWSIGYLDSGFGQSIRVLHEVKLKNKDGNYVTSLDPQGIQDAANNVINGPVGLPENHESWENVSLVNQPGAQTWPMCAFSYIYVRTDQSANAERGALLMAFVEYVLSDEGQDMLTEFAFVPVGAQVQEINSRGLGLIALHPMAVPYIVEGSTTLEVTGAGDRVISTKRTTFLYDSVDRLNGYVENLQEETASLRDSVALELHGSGTTNPSNFYLRVLDIISTRIQSPATLSYRAVGSSTGKEEFIADVNGFGSGDIPFFESDEVQMSGQEYLQFPILIGAVSVFYNLGEDVQVRLTPSLLAKIFSTEITRWDDTQILALNSDVESVLSAVGDIKVVHRKLGSSSTYVFTNYLQTSAAADWGLGAGSTITWPEGTAVAEGSQGIAAFLAQNVGSISYLDSGFGRSLADAKELRLMNKNQKYVTSEDPAGILAAATQAVEQGLPQNHESWKDVSLLDLPGDNTWPMCSFTYVYARTDQTNTGEAGALLLAFLQFIMSSEGQGMLPEFSFVSVGPEVEAINNAGLASMRLDPLAAPYTFETSTEPITGAGDRVISVKRSTWPEIERAALKKEIEALQTQVAELELQLLSVLSHEALQGTSSGQKENNPLAVASIILSVFSMVVLCFILYKLQVKNDKSIGTMEMSATQASSRDRVV